MTPAELASLLQQIEESRDLLVCHPDDEAATREAIRQAGLIIAPDVLVGAWVPQGQVLVIPAATRQRFLP
jgi:hypothetical protein